MNHSLYDHELDAIPLVDSKSGGDVPEEVTGDGRGPLGEWFAGLRLPDVICVGLAFGAFFSAQIALAMPSSRVLSAALLALLGLSVLICLLMRPRIWRLSLRVKGEFEKGLPQARARLTGYVAERKILVGFVAGIIASTSLMSIISPPQPTPTHLRGPVALTPPLPVANAVLPEMPTEGGFARDPAVVIAPRVPVVVPPLVEEAPEPKPEVSEAALQELRDGLRKQPVLRLGPIMDGVRRACESGDWQRSGWRDYALEFALDELVYRVKRATELPDLRLPVRFGELPAGIAEGADGVLWAGRPEPLRTAIGSILIVDGDLEVSFAKGCLILSTGRVNVRQGQGNFIVAGNAIDVYDENTRTDGKELEGVRMPSLWVSGTTIKMSYGRRLICSAPRGVEAHSIRESALLNSPVRSLNQVAACSEYSSKRLDFRLPHRADVAGRDEQPAGTIRGAWPGVDLLGAGRPAPGNSLPRMPINSQPVAAPPSVPARSFGR